MPDIHYAYLVWCGIFAVVWGFLYWARKDTRREMLMMSFLIAPLGPLSEYFHVMDYWRPETITGTLVGPENVLIAFLIGGISGAMYEFTYNVRRERRVRPGTWVYMAFAYVATTVGFIVGTGVLHLSSEQVLAALLTAFGAAAVIMRPQLLPNAFFSSISFGVFMFCFYQLLFTLYPDVLHDWWMLNHLSGIFIIGVPIEEVVWGFLWGFVAGPASELVARLPLPGYSRQ